MSPAEAKFDRHMKERVGILVTHIVRTHMYNFATSKNISLAPGKQGTGDIKLTVKYGL